MNYGPLEFADYLRRNEQGARVRHGTGGARRRARAGTR